MDRDVVVIGGSAGALDPLKEIVADLPVDTPAAVLVVLHVAADDNAEVLRKLLLDRSDA